MIVLREGLLKVKAIIVKWWKNYKAKRAVKRLLNSLEYILEGEFDYRKKYATHYLTKEDLELIFVIFDRACSRIKGDIDANI